MERIRKTTAELDQRARELRREATPAEAVLWKALRAGRLNGLKFRRQHAIGRFILDFYCATHRLCVEVDGEVHDQQRERDAARDAALLAHGVLTLRFRNEEITQDLPSVLNAILAGAHRPRP